MSLEEVVNQVHRLHTPSGGQHAIQEATAWLMNFQSSATWEQLVGVLNKGSSMQDELVFFFAANSIAQRAQSGRDASVQVADEVLRQITNLKGDNKQAMVIKRQLCVAYADLSLYGHGDLEKAVTALQQHDYPTMLEMLKIFPEEVKSTKVTVDNDQRMALINTLLLRQEQVFDALASSQTDAKLKLQACEQWLSLPSPQFIAQKEAGSSFTAEIIRRKCYEHPLLQLAAQSLSGDCIETADAACGTLIALITLTNEYSPVTSPAIELVAKSCINLANMLSPKIDENTWFPIGPTSPDVTPNIMRLNFVAKILAEIGPHFYRALGKSEWCTQMGDVALHWLKLRQTELGRGGLEFFYGALTAYNADPNRNDNNSLHPYLEKFTHSCLVATKYPKDPLAHEGFEIHHFVRFREHCNQCLQEAVQQLLPVSWVINLIGDKMQQMTEWEDLDSAVFILTGVCQSAPVGQDEVIPKLISHVPRFPYPNEGLGALLLRISAGRLILYTAGYIAMEGKEHVLIPTLEFLLGTLLPSLPKINVDDKDLKQYAQAICTDALRITTQSAKERILTLKDGSLWPGIIQRIVELVLNNGFYPDVQCQMVFSAGHIIGSIKDYDRLETTLADFCKQLEPKFDVSQAAGNRKEGKGPPEVKLYLAALSCCYNVKINRELNPQIQKHPVLHYWESQWGSLLFFKYRDVKFVDVKFKFVFFDIFTNIFYNFHHKARQ